MKEDLYQKSIVAPLSSERYHPEFLALYPDHALCT